jgi:hypothetical protein
LADNRIEVAESHDFSLRSVCWGYRDIFRKAIEALVQQGYLGEGRESVTEKFFDFVNCSDRSLFDHVVKELLEALGPRTAWILDVPSIFEDVLDLAAKFSQQKLYYGINYFRILGEGGFGSTPAEVRHLLTKLYGLIETDYGLAFALVQGYRALLERLTAGEIDLYVDEARRLSVRSQEAAMRFLRVEGRAAENTIQILTREARLQDSREKLERILRALSGRDIEIHVLSELDADELLERGSRLVGLYRWIYVPERIRFFPDHEKNRDWYLLQTVTAAASLSLDSFATIHGHREYESLTDICGHDYAVVNLLTLVEYCRVLRGAMRTWPGSIRLFRLGVGAERAGESTGPPEAFILDGLSREITLATGGDPDETPSGSRDAEAMWKAIDSLLDRSNSVFDSATLVDRTLIEQVGAAYPEYAAYPARALAFLPDPLFPVTESLAPPDSVVADLKQQSKDRTDGQSDSEPEEAKQKTNAHQDGEEAEEEEAEEGGVEAVYLYDEWNQKEGEYLHDYCKLRESAVPPAAETSVTEDLREETGRVKRIFEMLKPAVVRKEKYLSDGTEIDSDTLIEYLVARTRFPSPKIQFYQQPRILRRDLAVIVLLDVSGSTGEENDGQKILAVEKNAAVVLGHGLKALDDRFAVCGFSGNGREDCRYFVYKDFEAPWDEQAVATVMGAYPVSSTRIGPALRHSGYRLESVEAKQKLIILITDGRPMDQGYDPQSKYAQYDVRMACEENRRRSIHTFCISTTENSRSDMEIMFPQRRFVILEDIGQLPQVLPKLYIHLTV